MLQSADSFVVYQNKVGSAGFGLDGLLRQMIFR